MSVALLRLILIGLLAFVIIRFLGRLVSEVRSFARGRPGQPPQTPRRRVNRDIRDATFEDLTKENGEQKPGA